MTKKTIEETYKKLSQREHVLHRPNMYIGEIKKTLEEMWVFENDKMTKRMVEYSPAFLKIFDEVLTNALDHSNRDTTVDKIRVDYDITTGEISVLNNGSGVPVVVHKEHNLYVPELIFGHLLSGSNYDDSQQRIGAGVNGLGVKLGNIYSKRFVVETIDSETGLKFIQEFSENMETRSKPKVTKASGKSYTKITFLPDYARFHMSGLENDTTLLINKRVYDCIACTNKTVNVFLNGERLRGKGLVDYSNYFFEKDQVKSYYDTFTQRVGKNELVWEWIVVPSDHFEQVSFVNGNSTYQGGKHVDHIVYQITSKIKTLLETKKKLKDVKPAIIKERFFLFLRSTIINPQFSSQTKEMLTTQVKDFGCRIEVSDKFIDKLWKSPIVEDIIEFCKMKETMDLAKTTDGKKKNKIYVPKLEDALWAGTAKSDQCTLILTEGLSAMTFALWGRSIVGPDRWGVFPMKGKVLNIRDATVSQLMNNEEINNLKQIIGLKQGVDYKNTKDLRYGKVMILTDADCLVGDTPLLLKNNKNLIDIKTIDDLTQEWLKIEDDKFTGVLSDYEIWSDKGWTRIKRIIKKKTSKKIYRIVTHTGSIDVTEDHPLLSINKEEIMAKDVKLDDLLLHDFPLFMENKLDITDDLHNLKKKEMNKIASNAKIQYYDYKSKNNLITELISIKNKSYYELNTPVDISPNEAYVMGFFQTDGSCGIYKWKYNYKQKNRPKAYDINRTSYSWHISNDDIEKLIKSKNILSNLYDLEFKIIEDKTSEKKGYDKHYKLIINGGIKTKHIVEKYRNLFYDNNKLKKIPSCILNAPRNIREQFLQGIYDGDGDRKGFDKNGTRRIDINGKIGTQGLFYLYKSMGYEVSVNNRNDKPNIYTLIFTKGHQQSNPNRIKKIIDLGYTTDYVYDLETENHHFQGGIGQMIVHNCDGSHIKGLLVNLFHCWWPSLLKMDFIQTLRTPIVKAIRGQKVLEFYTEQDYHKWQSNTNTKGYQIRYFKGLGTSKKEDAQETFRKMNNLRIDYYHKDNLCDESIILAFEKDKNIKTKTSVGDEETKIETASNEETKADTETLNMKCSDKRKRWLAQYDRNSYIDTKESRVSYQDLIHKELIHFSIYDNLRSIPSLCDGLKPSQRKILYYMLKNNINKAIKVAQLSGYVSAETGYHHGEASLQGAIVSMAQDFVGSNNLNLLYPDGNMGSRLLGGKDAASPRYIFTKLSDATNSIFDKRDSPLLNYLNDDGMQIEPEWFMPVLPMVLVNGCEGIGTGYSTYIPPYNPTDIVANLLRVLDDKEPLPMKPYFRNFNGDLRETEPGSYSTYGKWQRVSDTQIKITELPVGAWVTTYKEFLETLVDSNTTKPKTTKSSGGTTKSKKQSVQLKDVQNKTRDENSDICFIVEFCKAEDLEKLIKNNTLEKTLRLSRSFTTNNMYLFSDELILTKYRSATDILLDFYDLRIEFYQKRRLYIIKQLQNELTLLNSKIRFINEYINGELDINRRKKEYIVNLLEERDYPKLKSDINDNSDKEDVNTKSFDYLVRMPLISLSLEKIQELEKHRDTKQYDLDTLQKKTERDLWRDDLQNILKIIQK